MGALLSLFGYQAMLWALALASVPVIIHLLNKRKHKVVEWGAMRFLVASMTSRHRKMKTEEILLLILRTLLVLLLVLALARPYLPDALVADPNAMSDVVVVIDGGHSMQTRQGKTTKFDQARQKAREFIDSLPAGHSVGLVVAFDRPEVLVSPSAEASADTLKQRLDAVRPYPCTLNMQDAVEKAVDLLAAGTHQVKKLVVITDGRRHGWAMDRFETWGKVEAAINRLPAARRAEFNSLILTLEDTGSDTRADEETRLVLRRAEVDRAVGLNRRVRVTAEIENISSRPQTGWKVRLIVDGNRERARTVELPDVPPAVRLRPVVEAVTTDGRTLLGTVESSDDAGVTIRGLNGLDERIEHERLKAPPRPPADVGRLVKAKLDELPAGDLTGRVELARWAAAIGDKRWAGDRLDEVLKADARNDFARRLRAFLDGVKGGLSVSLPGDRFDRPGSHVLTVELVPPGGDNPLDPRQSEKLAVAVIRSIPVLILNGDPFDPARPGMKPGDDEAFFLTRALRPIADASVPRTGRKVSPFEVIAPEAYTRGQLAEAMAKAGTADLAAFLRKRNIRVVVLANVAEPAPEEAEALEKFVGDGGGLLLLPGDKTRPVTWNGLRWLPAEFSARGGSAPVPVAAPPDKTGRGRRIDVTALGGSEVFGQLADFDGAAGLADADFFKWWRLTPRGGDVSVSVMLSLQGGEPLLVSRDVRRGRAVIAAFPGDRDWTNLPDSERGGAYVIVMHELIHFLAGVSGLELRVRPGDEFLYPLPEGFDVTRATVSLPPRPEDATVRTDEPVQRTIAERRHLVFGRSREPGIYRLTVQGRDATGRLGKPDDTVTLEQDFVVGGRLDIDDSPLNDDDRLLLAGLLAGEVGESVEKQADALFTREPEQALKLIKSGTGPMAIWHIIAWGTVAFLVAEVLMTRRIARRAGGGGSVGGIVFGQTA